MFRKISGPRALLFALLTFAFLVGCVQGKSKTLSSEQSRLGHISVRFVVEDQPVLSLWQEEIEQALRSMRKEFGHVSLSFLSVPESFPSSPLQLSSSPREFGIKLPSNLASTPMPSNSDLRRMTVLLSTGTSPFWSDNDQRMMDWIRKESEQSLFFVATPFKSKTWNRTGVGDGMMKSTTFQWGDSPAKNSLLPVHQMGLEGRAQAIYQNSESYFSHLLVELASLQNLESLATTQFFPMRTHRIKALHKRKAAAREDTQEEKDQKLASVIGYLQSAELSLFVLARQLAFLGEVSLDELFSQEFRDLFQVRQKMDIFEVISSPLGSIVLEDGQRIFQVSGEPTLNGDGGKSARFRLLRPRSESDRHALWSMYIDVLRVKDVRSERVNIVESQEEFVKSLRELESVPKEQLGDWEKNALVVLEALSQPILR